MAFILSYTKKGPVCYDSGNPDNYQDQSAYNCDLNDAMHLALSYDGAHYVPLRNNTGILFPRADFSKNVPGGITKTLIDPWIFRRADGSFGVCAVRRNENAPDPDSVGSIMLFYSGDLIRYEEAGFLQVDAREIRQPKCRFEEEKNAYYVEWESESGSWCGYSADLKEMQSKERTEQTGFEALLECRIADAAPSNVLEITEEEAKKLELYLGEIRNVGVEIPEVMIQRGSAPDFARLPEAVCLYNDGSVHEKKVCWDREAFERIDFAEPGEYEIAGEICRKRYPFPFLDAGISDPCVYRWQDRFFLCGTGERSVSFRVSDTLEGLREAVPFDIYRLPDSDRIHANLWAPELHVIKGVPYVFTTVGEQSWATVRSHVLRCVGDPEKPKDWEEPRLVLKPDGTELEEQGITLDMTYFCVDEIHYVMWSDRKFMERTQERTVADSADIYIAQIDPDAPWQLVTEPVRILRPVYGWDRCETEVDEGPYLLRRGDDLFVTISGSSTGLADLYCLGLLHAKAGADLLQPESWDWLPYPVLTKESVPGQFGPGHNNFVKDPDSGDDLLIYHAVPHDENGRALGRHMGVRRVHWGANGYPYLEMTPERDLDEKFSRVTLRIVVV